MGAPELFVIYLIEPFEDIRILNIHVPVRTDISFKKDRIFMGYPGRDMDTIGDMRDRNLAFRNPWPDMLPHLPGDFSMQFAHAVAILGHTLTQNKHGKRLIGSSRNGLSPRQHFFCRCM